MKQTQAEPKRERLLVFVISYYAENTLAKVLERIPAEIFETYDTEILVVDDASEDRTFEVGRAYQEAHPEIRMTVLRNQYNQGYGGNQKVGYTYAIAQGFDYVAMVHGDGQYAPEALPTLMRPFAERRADAVFGSRMMERFAALKGGMPLYKYVGNKILTRLQNELLGTALSEFHSGYRIYAVRALQRVPFRLSSNDFHFDTEIIIQLVNAGLRIVELPIPTFYGDEICRVDGMKYAKDVLKATLANRIHKAGLLYQRRYDTRDIDEAHYEVKLGYPSSHTYAVEAVRPGARVLDLGSAPAGLAGELAKKGCDVTVVEPDHSTWPKGQFKVVVQDLDEELQLELGEHDTLLLLDVIEHLRSPERFLEQLRSRFDHQAKTLILTTPNVAFVVPRLMLLLGQFNYGKAGVLDRTHARLFTFRSLEQLLRDEGFRIKALRGVPAPFPKALGDGPLGQAALALNLALIRVSKTLFSYQIYVEAEGTPNVEFLVRDAAEASGQVVPLKLRRTAN